jgi:hypothetical protein
MLAHIRQTYCMYLHIKKNSAPSLIKLAKSRLSTIREILDEYAKSLIA